MQTKHLCVLIHIWTESEVGASWNRFKPSIKIYTVPRRCYFFGSFRLFLYCFCYAFVRVCLLMPCGHLLGKGWHLGSRLWCLIMKLLLPHLYPWVRCGAWFYRFLIFALFLTSVILGLKAYKHWVSCERNASCSFIWIFLKLCRRFVKVWRCAWRLAVIFTLICVTFLLFGPSQF